LVPAPCRAEGRNLERFHFIEGTRPIGQQGTPVRKPLVPISQHTEIFNRSVFPVAALRGLRELLVFTQSTGTEFSKSVSLTPDVLWDSESPLPNVQPFTPEQALH